ncbi:MAG TPA: S8 family peptidase [Vicinamibacterales bacterium]|nr:S8 family peptidase [Vicinamibacterales bacterium]
MPKLRVRTLIVVAILASSVLGVRSAPRRAHLSGDLQTYVAKHNKARVRVIVRGTATDLEAIAARRGLHIVRRLPGAVVVLANSVEMNELSDEGGVDNLSGDLRVGTSMSVSDQSTAADQARDGTPGLLGVGALPAVTGQGIGVAILDSGITPHTALANRVVANVSFVPGDPSVTDGFGHGTHVAGIIGGNGAAAAGVTSLYTGGIAPGAALVNVRVLGNDGSGYVSNVIAGIEWVIAHKLDYNIRVINISLGHPVTDKCINDPLCQEIAKAVNAGIVVVAAAGNYGKSAAGNTVLGGIASPANSPYAVTVGALNTWSTAGRGDDTVATFSSRGPTPYDVAIKPDVAAPGVKIISLQADQSLLPTRYPQVHTAGSGNNAYMFLSGTSMAAPIVTGGVALLLQGAPSLTPAQVKLALQTGATYMAADGLVGAGAGSVNFWASRQSAENGLGGPLLDTLVGGLVTTPSGAAFWDEGTLGTRLYSDLGVRLLSSLDASSVWQSPSLLRSGDLNLLGLTNPIAAINPKGLQYGALAAYTADETIMWGTSILDVNGTAILWGTSGDETIMWGTSGDETIMWGTVATSPDAR